MLLKNDCVDPADIFKDFEMGNSLANHGLLSLNTGILDYHNIISAGEKSYMN